MAMTIKVLFVCLGNICRSPTAHGVFEQMVADKRMSDVISVDSAGTGDWHIGQPPDARSVQTALKRGYDLSYLRARQISAQDFSRFDYILAMDRANLSDLQSLQPAHFSGHVALFLDYAGNQPLREVPDPYYGEGEGFERVLQLVEQASAGLLQHIIQQHPLQ
jgi:protein-tyrosine phosphatase